MDSESSNLKVGKGLAREILDSQKPGKIHRMPEKGDRITLEGLRYKITYVDKALGKIHLQLEARRI